MAQMFGVVNSRRAIQMYFIHFILCYETLGGCEQSCRMCNPLKNKESVKSCYKTLRFYL